MVDPELLELMPDSVTIYRWTGQMNQKGRPILGTRGETYRCRVTYRDNVNRNPDSGQRTSHARVILDRAPGITVHDKVVLVGQPPSIITGVQRHSDQFGPYYESFDLA